MRFFALFVLLAVLFAAPLVFFGDALDTRFSGPEGRDRLAAAGLWAWALGLGLLVADLVMPVPSTVVMSAMGYLYGPILGGLISAGGSALVGLIAFGLSRLVGRHAAEKLVGSRDMARAERFFVRSGEWAVAVTRPIPLLAEVVACLAGLSGMPLNRFVPGLVYGCLPMGFVFAYVGHVGVDQPALAMGLSFVIPFVLWLAGRRWFDGG